MFKSLSLACVLLLKATNAVALTDDAVALADDAVAIADDAVALADDAVALADDYAADVCSTFTVMEPH